MQIQNNFFHCHDGSKLPIFIRRARDVAKTNVAKFFLIFSIALVACTHTPTHQVSEIFVESDTAKLKTYIYGHGQKTLILVHGGPGLPGYMRSLGNKLQSKFRVVEYLQRDSAQSQSKGPFTINAKGQDLLAVVKQFSDIGRPIVIAHSGGTLATMEFAKGHPNLVEKLILISASGLSPETDKEYDSKLSAGLSKLIPEWNQKLKAAEENYKLATTPQEKHQKYHEMLDLYWPAYFSNGKKDNRLQFEPANLNASKETEADYKRCLNAGVFKRNLKMIKTSVVHLHGKMDPLPWQRTNKEYSKHLPNYQLDLIEGAGHFPWLEREEIANLFITKLEKHLSSEPH